jgi:hypothetical protein
MSYTISPNFRQLHIVGNNINVNATSPLFWDPGTATISIQVANATQSGYLSNLAQNMGARKTVAGLTTNTADGLQLIVQDGADQGTVGITAGDLRLWSDSGTMQIDANTITTGDIDVGGIVESNAISIDQTKITTSTASNLIANIAAPYGTVKQSLITSFGGYLHSLYIESAVQPTLVAFYTDAIQSIHGIPVGTLVETSVNITPVAGGLIQQKWLVSFSNDNIISDKTLCYFVLNMPGIGDLVTISQLNAYTNGQMWQNGVEILNEDLTFELFVDVTNSPTAESISDDISMIDNSSLIIPTQRATKQFATIRSTGILTGGIISINLLDNTKFDISAGSGIIHDPITGLNTKIVWPELIGLTTVLLATYAGSWISLYLVGNAVLTSQDPIIPSPLQRRTKIVLGRLSHFNKTNITGVFVMPFQAYEDQLSSDILVSFPIILNDGYDVAASIPVPLGLTSTEGTFLRKSANFLTSAISPDATIILASTAINFFRCYRTGVDDIILVPATTVDPTMWDNGSGILQTVPAGNFTLQLMIVFPYNGSITVFILYGQKTYANLAAAVRNISGNIDIHAPAKYGLERCAIIMIQSTVNLATSIANGDADIIPFSKIGRV